MTKTCKKCGLKEEEHIIDGLHEPDLNGKGCKRFVAEDNHTHPGQDVGESQSPMKSGKLLNPGTQNHTRLAKRRTEKEPDVPIMKASGSDNHTHRKGSSTSKEHTEGAGGDKLQSPSSGSDFDLNKKRTYAFNGNLGDITEYCYPEEDIKEFIRRRVDDLHDIKNGNINLSMALARLRKDAGGKLR